jgi:hypothetical protein
LNQIAGSCAGALTPSVKAEAYPGGGTDFYLDVNVVPGTTYYYEVVPATGTDEQTCQGSNPVQQAILGKGRN